MIIPPIKNLESSKNYILLDLSYIFLELKKYLPVEKITTKTNCSGSFPAPMNALKYNGIIYIPVSYFQKIVRNQLSKLLGRVTGPRYDRHPLISQGTAQRGGAAVSVIRQGRTRRSDTDSRTEFVIRRIQTPQNNVLSSCLPNCFLFGVYYNIRRNRVARS